MFLNFTFNFSSDYKRFSRPGHTQSPVSRALVTSTNYSKSLPLMFSNLVFQDFWWTVTTTPETPTSNRRLLRLIWLPFFQLVWDCQQTQSKLQLNFLYIMFSSASIYLIERSNVEKYLVLHLSLLWQSRRLTAAQRFVFHGKIYCSSFRLSFPRNTDSAKWNNFFLFFLKNSLDIHTASLTVQLQSADPQSHPTWYLQRRRAPYPFSPSKPLK